MMSKPRKALFVAFVLTAIAPSIPGIGAAEQDWTCASAAQAAATDAHAIFWLGHQIYIGQCTGTKNAALALTLKAANMGIAAAKYNYAVMYATSNPGHNGVLYLKYLRLAADEGYLDAIFALGTEYSNGSYTEADLAKAHAMFERAASFGHGRALIQLGANYASGEGTARDEKAAWRATRNGVQQLESQYNDLSQNEIAALAMGYFNLAKLANSYEECGCLRNDMLIRAAELGEATAQSFVLDHDDDLKHDENCYVKCPLTTDTPNDSPTKVVQ